MNGRRCSGHRTSQNDTILERLGCVTTVTDSRHSLFGQRFTVLPERSGRGLAFVVVALPDGRRRSIRISCTDLGHASPPADKRALDPPRVSVRTLIPLARHLNATLSLLVEEVIRDDSSSSSASRSVSIAVDSGLRIRPARIFPPMAQSVGRDANAARPAARATDAAHAAGRRRNKKGERSC
jgi:hypothetical protein